MKKFLSISSAMAIALMLSAPTSALAWWNPPANQTASADANAGAGASNGATASGRHTSTSAFDTKKAKTSTEVDIPSRGWASGSANANANVNGGAMSSFADRRAGRGESFVDMGAGGNAEVTVNNRTQQRGFESSVFGGAVADGSATGRHSMTVGQTSTVGYAGGGAHVSSPGGDSANAYAGMESVAKNTSVASDRTASSVDNSVGSGSSATAATTN